MSRLFSAPCAQRNLAVQVSRTKENIYEHGKDTAEKYSTEEYGNLDTYQVPHQQALPQSNTRLCTLLHRTMCANWWCCCGSFVAEGPTRLGKVLL